MKIRRRRTTGAIATLLLAGSIASTAPALAATIPFSAALNLNHNPALGLSEFFQTDARTNSAPPSQATSSQSESGVWGSTGGTARADLASGQLGGSVYGNLTGSGVFEYNSIYSQTNAYFGDGFRTSAADGSPFEWVGGSTARFGITVDGTLSGSRSPAALDSGAFVLLFIYDPNTLDPDHVFGFQPNLRTTFFYQIGNPNLAVTSCDFSGNCANLAPSAYLGNLNAGPITVTQDFQPGSDFDYVLLLGAYGRADVPGEAFDYDLSHTVTFSYEGPDGTTTTSESGLFTNYSVPPPTPTPAPAVLGLLAAALIGTRVLGRRATRA